jgi:type IV secretory pathway VirD2 relaxase
MLIRDAIQARLTARDGPEDRAGRARLPRSLKSDATTVRTALFQRLAASRLFARGDRAGVLRSAQARSGRAFRLDVRQKVIVKVLVSRHLGKGAERGAALAKHAAYLGRAGAGVEGARAEFFDREHDGVDPAAATAATAAWSADRHHFRLIVSPEHGDRIADLRGYVREVMTRVSADLGQPELRWLATCHFDTDQPHAHVLIRGKRASGKDLVIPRDYVAYGIRARAQEVAQERLGDLSRANAERRVWRETQADRFTGFDRRLLDARDADGLVPDGVGSTDAWAALSRGRLRHLERLGLAERVGSRYRLPEDAERRLRVLQLRKDVIRTLHARRLEGAQEVRELGADRVRGRVVARGAHDELGATPFVVVRDTAGVEHYARLAFGQATPELGRGVDLVRTERGAAVLEAGRGADLSR